MTAKKETLYSWDSEQCLRLHFDESIWAAKPSTVEEMCFNYFYGIRRRQADLTLLFNGFSGTRGRLGSLSNGQPLRRPCNGTFRGAASTQGQGSSCIQCIGFFVILGHSYASTITPILHLPRRYRPMNALHLARLLHISRTKPTTLIIICDYYYEGRNANFQEDRPR